MEEGFVDLGDRADFFIGVVIHCCVFNCGFRVVVRSEQEVLANVGEYLDAGSPGACLDVLKCQVVCFLGQRLLDRVRDEGLIVFYECVYVQF